MCLFLLPHSKDLMIKISFRCFNVHNFFVKHVSNPFFGMNNGIYTYVCVHLKNHVTCLKWKKNVLLISTKIREITFHTKKESAKKWQFDDITPCLSLILKLLKIFSKFNLIWCQCQIYWRYEYLSVRIGNKDVI